MVEPQNRNALERPGQHGGKRRAEHAPMEHKHKHRIARDIQKVAHGAYNHRQPGVSRRPIHGRTGIINAHKRVGQRRHQKVDPRRIHHIRFHAAKYQM